MVCYCCILGQVKMRVLADDARGRPHHRAGRPERGLQVQAPARAAALRHLRVQLQVNRQQPSSIFGTKDSQDPIDISSVV